MVQTVDCLDLVSLRSSKVFLVVTAFLNVLRSSYTKLVGHAVLARYRPHVQLQSWAKTDRQRTEEREESSEKQGSRREAITLGSHWKQIKFRKKRRVPFFLSRRKMRKNDLLGQNFCKTCQYDQFVWLVAGCISGQLVWGLINQLLQPATAR